MKYYKIINKEKKHHNLSYNPGIIQDPIEFNPSGDCTPGGIYFAKEDILAFLDYGCYISEVSLLKDSKIYKNPKEPIKYKANKIILGKFKKITLTVIKELVKEGANIHAGKNAALKWASLNGHLEIVKYLIQEGADLHAENNYALRRASLNGHLEIVKYLIQEGADIHAGSEYALRLASQYGHLEVVKYLIKKGANIHAEDEYALRWASENGHLEIVEYLHFINQ